MFGKEIWPKAGWITDPHSTGGTGTAHATYPGSDTAICGAPTPFLGKTWPRADDYWVLPFRRCPACAHRVYAPEPH